MVKIVRSHSNYITAGTYAIKYGISVKSAREIACRGIARSYTLSSDGAGGQESLFLEDVDAISSRRGERYRGGKKLCGGCLSWLPRSEYYDCEWSPASRQCKVCTAAAVRRRKVKRRGASRPCPDIAIDNLITASSRAAEIEKQYVLTAEQREQREQRVQAHAARIEAMGLAGDGEVFPDGE